MPTILKTKNSVTATNAPSSLEQGELAVNITDKKVWVGNAATTPVLLLGSGADASFTNISVSGVASFADGTVSLPSITNIGDTNTGIFFPAADTIAFAEGGVEAMRINSSGQVGIGTSTPAYSLDVRMPSGDSVIQVGSTAVSGNNRVSVDGGGSNHFGFYLREHPALTTSTATPTSLRIGSDGTNTNFQTQIFYTNAVERMRITSTGGVGIGTATPTNASNYGSLAVNGSSGAFIDAYVNGTRVGSIEADASNVYVQSVSNVPMLLRTNSTERMRIDTSGNVGIGTSTPSAGLDIVKSTLPTVSLSTTTANNTVKYSAIISPQYGSTADPEGVAIIGVENSAADNIIAIGGYFGEFNAASNIRFYTANSLTTRSGTERMRIDSSGNVGIGKTPTDKPLEIYGAGSPALRIQNSTTGTGAGDGLLLEMSGSNINFYNYEAGAIIFGTSVTERMRIDSSGNVLVGTTTAVGSSKFVVNGNFGIYNSNSSTCQDQVFITNTTSSSGVETTLFTITSLSAIVSIIFEVSVTNGVEPGYSMAKSTRQLLLSNYGGATRIISSTELSNQQSSINAGVINTTVATAASISGSNVLLTTTVSTTGAAGYTTGQSIVGKMTVTSLGTITATRVN